MQGDFDPSEYDKLMNQAFGVGILGYFISINTELYLNINTIVFYKMLYYN